MEIVQVSLNIKTHASELIKLIGAYMVDEMGAGKPMRQGMDRKILEGLKNNKAYLGFFVKVESSYVALANCNLLFSTFAAKPLVNIHDFIVLPEYRGRGIAQFLLKGIERYAIENGYCRINLEVREDNVKAQKLYKKMGFGDCSPNMVFWEKNL